MSVSTPPLIRCDICGNRRLAITGPLTDEAIVHCDGCSRGVGTWRECLAGLTARMAAADHGPGKLSVSRSDQGR